MAKILCALTIARALSLALHGHAVLVGLSARHRKLVETKNCYNTVALVEQTSPCAWEDIHLALDFLSFSFSFIFWKESSFLVIKQRTKNSRLYDFKSQ